MPPPYGICGCQELILLVLCLDDLQPKSLTESYFRDLLSIFFKNNLIPVALFCHSKLIILPQASMAKSVRV